jgi:hypothetical protein
MLPHMQLTGLVKLHCSAGHLAERQLWAETVDLVLCPGNPRTTGA